MEEQNNLTLSAETVAHNQSVGTMDYFIDNINYCFRVGKFNHDYLELKNVTDMVIISADKDKAIRFGKFLKIHAHALFGSCRGIADESRNKLSDICDIRGDMFNYGIISMPRHNVLWIDLDALLKDSNYTDGSFKKILSCKLDPRMSFDA